MVPMLADLLEHCFDQRGGAYRLRRELRSHLQRTREPHRVVTVEMPWWRGVMGHAQYHTTGVAPLYGEFNRYEGTSIRICSATKAQEREDQPRAAPESLETTNEVPLTRTEQFSV